jgi:tetratricopeptide (TPR) repeat protein
MLIFVPARARHAATSLTTTLTLPKIAAIKRPQTNPRQLLEMVYSADLAVRRATIATLAKQADHKTAHLLRQLLVDPQPEIRSDAAILLKRMEERYAQDLQTALEAWQAQPTKERTLALVEQYYQYASSNILDEAIQHFYYQRAYDLLLPIVQKHRKEAALWMRLAYLHSHFGDFIVGLYAACQAWELQPTSTEAYQLALDLAFRAHAWDKLNRLTKKGQSMVSHMSNIGDACQSWAA